jgi:hypothetical protein
MVESSNIPNGTVISNEMVTRLNNEINEAAPLFAEQIVAHYMNEREKIMDITLMGALCEVTFSGLAKKYWHDQRVFRLAQNILLHQAWELNPLKGLPYEFSLAPMAHVSRSRLHRGS